MPRRMMFQAKFQTAYKLLAIFYSLIHIQTVLLKISICWQQHGEMILKPGPVSGSVTCIGGPSKHTVFLESNLPVFSKSEDFSTHPFHTFHLKFG